MQTTRSWIAAGLLGLASCTTIPASGAPADAPDSISYETGPCFGACPVYRVTLYADGRGTFEGRRFTAVEGERSFRATPDQFRAFSAHLAPVRPASGSVRHAGENCAMTATDMPSAEVRWRSTAGEQSLYFYFGCDMERHRALAERLRAAPALLPIAEMIGGPQRPSTG